MTQKIGHYEVMDIVGDGGMGTVFTARDPRFDRVVAIKVLHPALQRDELVVERFKNEAVIQAKLSHPNIVAVYDFVDDDSSLAMVMEHIQGKPLDALIEDSQGPMETQRMAALLLQVLAAMAFAHRRGLVHRDLKPSNVIVQELEGQEIAKVLDFGVAKILGSEKMRTATSAKMGTICYMSPEQLKSPKTVDARSDIYSLGVMMYEMLTGERPFDGDSEYEVMRMTVEQLPPSPSMKNPEVPQKLQSVLLKALEKSPEDRYQDCDEFAEQIVEAISDDGISDGTPIPSAPEAHVEEIGPTTIEPPPWAESGDEREVFGQDRSPVSSRKIILTLIAVVLAICISATVIIGQKTQSTSPPAPGQSARGRSPERTALVVPTRPAPPRKSVPVLKKTNRGVVERGDWFVQVGAFGSPDNVAKNLRELEDLGFETSEQKFEELTRVRVGPFATRAEAVEVVEKLRPHWPPARVFHRDD